MTQTQIQIKKSMIGLIVMLQWFKTKKVLSITWLVMKD